MLTLLNNFLAMSQFSPHGFCLAWEPWTLALFILGDGLTAVAYLAIPVQLVLLMRRTNAGQDFIIQRKTWILVMFALFILMCGIDHDLDVITLWWPYYHIQAAWKIMLGIVSLSTSILLGSAVTVVPKSDSYQG